MRRIKVQQSKKTNSHTCHLTEQTKHCAIWRGKVATPFAQK